MNLTRTVTGLSCALAISTAAIALPSGAALADAPSNGCPSGYTLLSVGTLSSAGYRVPAEVDSPTSGVHSFGQPGNGDGLVCGVQLGNQVGPYGPIYNFIDDQLPAK